MSAANTTRIFGMRIGVDPKLLIGGLVAVAAILYWYNSRSDEGAGAAVSSAARPAETTQIAPAPAREARTTAVRRAARATTNDRNRLRLRPDINAAEGNIDPTLRLDLLSRLRTVEFEPSHRSVFDIGAAAPQSQLLVAIKKAPILPPKPLPVQPQYPQISQPPPLNIPLKYYGFVKPVGPGQANQGFFLDGDNILVASEGQVLKQQFMVVELTPNSAKMEDIQRKQGQSLPVVPAALQQP